MGMSADNIRLKNLSQRKEWEVDFEILRQKILLSNDVRRKNYSKKYFDFNQVLDVSIVYENANIVGFSSILGRTIFPAGSCRVLNRFWKAPAIRRFERYHRLLGKLMLDTQMAKAKDLGFECCFISMERKNVSWLTKWVHEVNLASDGLDWKVLPQRVLVCDDDKSPQCWQFVAMCCFNSNYNFNAKTISEDDYRLLL